MKSTILRAIKRAVLGVFTLFFIACPKPVSLKTFLDDEKLLDVTERNNVEIDIDYQPPAEERPELQWGLINEDPAPFGDGQTIRISMTDIGVIEVSNQAKYDPGSIEWSCDVTPPPSLDISGDNNEKLTIEAGIPPFNEERTYTITVIGKKDAIPYSTTITVKVES